MTDERLSDLWATRERAVLFFITLLTFGVLVYTVWRFVGAIVLGLFLYYVTRPIHSRIAPRFASRTISTTLAIFTITIPVMILVVWTFVAIARALSGFLGSGILGESGLGNLSDLTALTVDIQPIITEFLANPAGFPIDELIASLGDGGSISGVLGAVGNTAGSVFNAGLLLFGAVIIVFFLVRDDHRIAAWARATVIREGSPLETYLEAVDRDLHKVYFGNILNAVFTGLLGAVTYFALNLIAPEAVRIPEPVLFGLLGGVASLIPVIGIKLVWVPLAIVLVAEALLNNPSALWFPAVFVAVSVVIVDLLPDQFLRPYVSGRSLHVGAVMLAYTFGPLMFGWYGLFLGPLLLVVIVESGRHLVPALTGRTRLDGLASDDTPTDTGDAVGSDDVLDGVPPDAIGSSESRPDDSLPTE